MTTSLMKLPSRPHPVAACNSSGHIRLSRSRSVALCVLFHVLNPGPLQLTPNRFCRRPRMRRFTTTSQSCRSNWILLSASQVLAATEEMPLPNIDRRALPNMSSWHPWPGNLLSGGQRQRAAWLAWTMLAFPRA